MSLRIKNVMIAAAATFLGLVGAANAAEYQDIVTDKNNQVITSTFGDCVRTKWMVNADTCGLSPEARDLTKISREARTIYFDFNSAKLTTESKGKLDRLVSLVRASKQVKSMDIVGYADRIGGKGDYNQRLSQRRAQAVKAYLNAKGYKQTRNVMVRGKGTSKSVTQCDPKMPRKDLIVCLAEDRRVEIELNLAK